VILKQRFGRRADRFQEWILSAMMIVLDHCLDGNPQLRVVRPLTRQWLGTGGLLQVCDSIEEGPNPLPADVERHL
jgi:hypothetical protein